MDRMDLEDIITDDVLKESFLVFLRGNYMSTNLELWLDIAEYEAETTDVGRENLYNGIHKRYFEKGCESPVCLPNRIAHSITQYYQASYLSFAYGKQVKRSFPSDLFFKAKEELWMILQLTCLPMFLMSEAYQDFLKGVTDSARTLFSRKKCEQFFGQTIQGPLKRQEILAVYGSSGMVSNRQNQKRINDEVKRESKFFKQKKTKKDKDKGGDKGMEKEKEKEREKEREREREREREKQSERDKDKERERAKERERGRMAASGAPSFGGEGGGTGGGEGGNQAVGLWELFK